MVKSSFACLGYGLVCVVPLVMKSQVASLAYSSLFCSLVQPRLVQHAQCQQAPSPEMKLLTVDIVQSLSSVAQNETADTVMDCVSVKAAELTNALKIAIQEMEKSQDGCYWAAVDIQRVVISRRVVPSRLRRTPESMT